MIILLPWKLLLISGIALPSRVHKSFSQNMQIVTTFIYLFWSESKSLFLHKSHLCLESSAFPTSPELTSCRSRGFWKRKPRVLQLRTHSLHWLPPSKSENSKLICSHFLPLPQISCKPPKAEKKISRKISKANLWDWGLFHHVPLERVIYSTQGFFNSGETPIFTILKHALLLSR